MDGEALLRAQAAQHPLKPTLPFLRLVDGQRVVILRLFRWSRRFHDVVDYDFVFDETAPTRGKPAGRGGS